MDESKILPGVYRAVVTEKRDPEHRGRIQIEIRSISGDAQAWAPMLSQGRGTFFTPEPGDEVIVAFEAGNLRSPIVLGMLWDASSRPPTGGER